MIFSLQAGTPIFVKTADICTAFGLACSAVRAYPPTVNAGDGGNGKTEKRTAFVYIMHEDRPLGRPSGIYVQTCLDGYVTLARLSSCRSREFHICWQLWIASMMWFCSSAFTPILSSASRVPQSEHIL